uniref:Uncharacterized protein n=1 Tax=Octopus bimaculoides TaxID=37653 RepID=A0A0L8H3A6_OCTBM
MTPLLLARCSAEAALLEGRRLRGGPAAAYETGWMAPERRGGGDDDGDVGRPTPGRKTREILMFVELELLLTFKEMDRQLNEGKRNFADVAKCQEHDIDIGEFENYKTLLSWDGFDFKLHLCPPQETLNNIKERTILYKTFSIIEGKIDVMTTGQIEKVLRTIWHEIVYLPRGTKFGVVEVVKVRFKDAATTKKHAATTIKSEEVVLLPTYRGQRATRVRVEGIRPERCGLNCSRYPSGKWGQHSGSPGHKNAKCYMERIDTGHDYSRFNQDPRKHYRNNNYGRRDNGGQGRGQNPSMLQNWPEEPHHCGIPFSDQKDEGDTKGRATERARN